MHARSKDGNYLLLTHEMVTAKLVKFHQHEMKSNLNTQFTITITLLSRNSGVYGAMRKDFIAEMKDYNNRPIFILQIVFLSASEYPRVCP